MDDFINDLFFNVYMPLSAVCMLVMIFGIITDARRMARRPFCCRLCRKHIDEHGDAIGLGASNGEAEIAPRRDQLEQELRCHDDP